MPDTPLHTEHWGPDGPGAPRALMVHGITSSAASMWELGEGLADVGWSVTAVDLPGHGGTGARASYAFADMVAGLASLGEGWDLYIGHSLGGLIGVQLLASHPGIAQRAVLLDPALYVPAARLPALAEELAGSLLERDPAVIAAQFPGWHPRTVDERVAANVAAVPDAMRAIAGSNAWDVRALAPSVTVPVLVLLAATDTVVAPAVRESITAAGTPSWSWETVPDTGHSLHRDQPAVVLRRILVFAG